MDGFDRSFARLAERRAEPPPDGPSDEDLRQEFVDSLRGRLSQAAQLQPGLHRLYVWARFDRAGRLRAYGRVSALARAVDVEPGTLLAWLHGRNISPAEYKIRLAELLCVPIEECWTPEVLAAAYVGPRGGGRARTVRSAVDA